MNIFLCWCRSFSIVLEFKNSLTPIGKSLFYPVRRLVVYTNSWETLFRFLYDCYRIHKSVLCTPSNRGGPFCELCSLLMRFNVFNQFVESISLSDKRDKVFSYRKSVQLGILDKWSRILWGFALDSLKNLRRSLWLWHIMYEYIDL